MSRLQKRLGRARVSRTPTPLTTDDEYESDTASVASVDSLWGNDPETVDIKGKWQDEMLETIDTLGERKGSSASGREELLKSFVRVASLKVITEDSLAGRAEELVGILGRTVKSGRSEKEIILAGRAISLLAASVPEVGSLSTSILPLLQQMISDGENDSAIPTLIYALASIAFFSPTLSSEDILPILTFLMEILQSNGHSIGCGDDDEIISAAIEAFSILLSALEDPYNMIQQYVPVLVDSLSSSSISVRLASGECIALAYELAPITSDSEDETPDTPPYDDIDHLTSLLSSLSTVSSKRLSKNSRREQHSLFRDILRTVSTHQPLPTQKLRFARKEELRLDSWEKLLRLKHLRRIFTHGLHVHLAGNVHVRQALELPPPSEIVSGGSSEDDEGMTTAERRSLQKEVRRLREGRVKRDRKRAGEGRMIDVFGEDDD
jgi:Interferon-related developmental regulator (IFRD)